MLGRKELGQLTAHRRALGTLGLLVPLALAGATACGKDEPAPNPETTQQAPTELPRTSTPASTSAATSTATNAATTSPSEKPEVSSVAKEASSVRKVAEMYGSLAPEEFFKMFENCAPNGIPDSSACTGPDVGQFQFFKGDAKAASTTQLLTELRSSRVVEDSGDRIVGWSTLGTTAVITVVDNKKGLTMQQMVSSDKQDPLKRIYELGLATPAETSTPTPTAENL
ncbi:hypothetical protein WG915_07320 [Corynebacterium sp. H128]|uniref:hypothetical protein n=1 Tax=unclassified Corynebacterium TaxID=2624378 RepID=UPI00309E8C29